MKLSTANGGKCSGTHIGEGKILTAAHCIDKDTDKLEATFKGGESHEASVLWFNRAYDVALLDMGDVEGPSSDIACRVAQPGETITMHGNPLAMNYISTTGTIAGDIVTTYDTAWLQVLPVDGAMGPGMSGGGSFDEDGNLIGINVGVPIAGNGFGGGFPIGISFIVPSSVACDLLAR